MELIVRSNTLALGGYYMAERLTAWRANKAMMRFKRRQCQFLPQIRLLHTEGLPAFHVPVLHARMHECLIP
jgi:hypothetical protein